MKLNRVVLTGNGVFMLKYGINTLTLFTNHAAKPLVSFKQG